MKMSEPLENPTLFPSMFSAEGFPAKTSQSRGRGRASKRVPAADSGSNLPVLLARYDPATSSWKTSGRYSVVECSEFSETFPLSGTIQNGELFELPHLAFSERERGCGLWPTPTATDYKGSSSGCRKIHIGEISMLRHFLHFHFKTPELKTSYPHPTLLERRMGYPI